MIRTSFLESIRTAMSRNIKSYNKYMTDQYLQTLMPIQLLRLSHPLDRPAFAMECHKAQLITLAQFRECTQKWEINKQKSNEIKKRFTRT